MTIREIIGTVATFTGRKDLKTVIETGEGYYGESVSYAAEKLTELANLVIDELACSYIPAVTAEDLKSTGGRIYYKDFTKTPLKVLKVSDLQGNRLDFSYSPEYITVNVQSAAVEYEFLPEAYKIDDEICYSEKDVPKRVLAYGVTAEFCITEGDFDEAVTWHKRYIDALSDICLPKNKNVKARRWG